MLCRLCVVKMAVIWLALMLPLFKTIGALKDPTIPEGLFYPFGGDVGDTVQTPGVDLFSAVPISANFSFFNASHTTLYVSVKSRPICILSAS